MKDYIQVSESVFRKAEERMAEKKRRSMKIKRNTLAATSAAAVLVVVCMQNESISNAIKSIPKFVSSVWTGEEPTTTQITTQPVTTTVVHTITSEITTETTTETETTTTTETVTAEPVTEPATTTVTEPTDNMKKVYMVGLDTRVVEADYDTVTLSNGYKVSFIYGEYDLRGLFKVDDIIFYRCSFAYDQSRNIYYYLDGYFEAEQRTIESSDENGESVTEEFRGAPIPAPEPENKEKELRQLKYDDSVPALDYADILADPSMLTSGEGYDDMPIIKIKVTGLKIAEADGYNKRSEDGRNWYLYSNLTEGMENEDVYNLKEGDVIDMVGFFRYYKDEDTLDASDIYIQKVN